MPGNLSRKVQRLERFTEEKMLIKRLKGSYTTFCKFCMARRDSSAPISFYSRISRFLFLKLPLSSLIATECRFIPSIANLYTSIVEPFSNLETWQRACGHFLARQFFGRLASKYCCRIWEFLGRSPRKKTSWFHQQVEQRIELVTPESKGWENKNVGTKYKHAIFLLKYTAQQT